MSWELKTSSVPITLAILALATGLAGRGAGQVVPCELLKLTASDAAAYDYFGVVSVSHSLDDGTYAIVGAPGDDPRGSFSGSAYMFRFDASTSRWIEQQKLTASEPRAGDYECFI